MSWYKVTDKDSRLFGKVLEVDKPCVHEGDHIGYYFKGVKKALALEQITLTHNPKIKGISHTTTDHSKVVTKIKRGDLSGLIGKSKHNCFKAEAPIYAEETDESGPYDDETVVNFGDAHKGDTLGECSESWLIWCQDTLDKEKYKNLHNYIDNNQDAIQQVLDEKEAEQGNNKFI